MKSTIRYPTTEFRVDICFCRVPYLKGYHYRICQSFFSESTVNAKFRMKYLKRISRKINELILLCNKLARSSSAVSSSAPFHFFKIREFCGWNFVAPLFQSTTITWNKALVLIQVLSLNVTRGRAKRLDRLECGFCTRIVSHSQRFFTTCAQKELHFFLNGEVYGKNEEK